MDVGLLKPVSNGLFDSARTGTGTGGGGVGTRLCRVPGARWLEGLSRFHAGLSSDLPAHLLRRTKEMPEVSSVEAAEFPLAVKAILKDGLQLRDRCAQGRMEEHGLAVACGKLEARPDRVLRSPAAALCPANRRLANHLLGERNAIFTFLHCPGLDATGSRAEQAIRPMVVTRKTWGGNRTATGAHTQSVLASVLQTCRQQFRSAIDVFQRLLRSPKSLALDLTLPQPR